MGTVGEGIDQHVLRLFVHPINRHERTHARTEWQLGFRSLDGNACEWGRLRRIIAIETGLFQIQAKILRDRRNEVTTVHGKLPDQAPEMLTIAEGDRLSCNGPALSPRERPTASCASEIWTAVRSSVLAGTMPPCGSKPPRPCFCSDQSDGRDGIGSRNILRSLPENLELAPLTALARALLRGSRGKFALVEIKRGAGPYL
jgi:hypothetical protein